MMTVTSNNLANDIKDALKDTQFSDAKLMRLIPQIWTTAVNKLESCVEAAAICALTSDPKNPDSDSFKIYCNHKVFPRLFQVLIVPIDEDDKKFLR